MTGTLYIPMYLYDTMRLDEMDSLYDTYKSEIGRFFSEEFFHINNREKGHIWIARHTGFETLTVEPGNGNQFEIAVRMPLDKSNGEWNNPQYKYSGYHISRQGWFIGINTGGH